MTKLQAILHLYKTRRISEEKASLLAEEKKLTESEIEILESEIEKIRMERTEQESNNECE